VFAFAFTFTNSSLTVVELGYRELSHSRACARLRLHALGHTHKWDETMRQSRSVTGSASARCNTLPRTCRRAGRRVHLHFALPVFNSSLRGVVLPMIGSASFRKVRIGDHRGSDGCQRCTACAENA
jgi:hypothetical protein